MANKMLIDSSHPEETRVVVTRGNKVEEFDFESANRRQLRGNIYLAKVTRVEPSLQAAFIEYGGNRHGFLAFSEIHPDYYQIPVADRQALLEADERAEREAEEDDEKRRSRGSGGGGASGGNGGGGSSGGRRRRGAQRRNRRDSETVSGAADLSGDPEEAGPADSEPGLDEDVRSDLAEAAEHEARAAPDDGRDAAAEPELPLEGDADEGATKQEALAPADAPPASPEGVPDHAQASFPHPESGLADADGGPEPYSELASTALEESSPAESRTNDDSEDEADEDEDDDEELEEHEQVEQVGGADALEEVPERPRVHRRHYKIQEVIKRRQILLVQVVKEERGNKGAALTTYLSLAGRYAVLMPNTGKGGGISRKITSAEDRKRLKEIVQDLEVPDGMGIILRTAGAARTRPEIKRDFEYLMRLWESVRELTLKSSAPALVYEEGSLIKRAIRDLYSKEIDEVVVAGAEGHREAKDFMRMIMPSNAKAVMLYDEPQALFAQHGVEAQLDAMFSTHVTLRSGGYLVINPTEALVSIDVNSGRATREHNIEDTALKTNMEAAEEIARQLRLRDLAGLIVIDFIDMEERRNDRSVEKKLKDCLKNDRARIQVGRISPFGLLEMSRQRIRTGVLESSSLPCRHCAGTGFVRGVPSVALQILRSVEETLLRSTTHNLIVRTRLEVAFYILNQKRAHLTEIEARFGAAVAISPDETLIGATTFAVDRGGPIVPSQRPAAFTGIRVDSITPVDEPIEIEPTVELEREEEEEQELRAERLEVSTEPGELGEDGGRKRRRRRRRRGRGPGGAEAGGPEGSDAGDDEDEEGDEAPANGSDRSAGADREDDEAAAVAALPPDDSFPDGADMAPRRSSYTAGPSSMANPIAGQDSYEPSRPDALTDVEADVSSQWQEGGSSPEIVVSPEPTTPEPEPEPVAVVLTPPDPDRPKRGGWWSKAKSALGGG